MTETERPRAGGLAAVSAMLAMAGTGRALLAARVAGAMLPSERAGLWVDAQLRWVVPVTLAFGLGAVVCAVLAQRRGRDEVSVLRTARVAGMLGWISLFGVTLTAMAAPVLPRARGSDLKTLCFSNMRSIATALAMYSEDWGRQPPAGKWSDLTRPHTTESYRCPEAAVACGYARNRALAGLPTAQLREPAKTVLLFESDRGWNAEGGPELLPDWPRHYQGENIAFADGHVQWYARRAPRGEVRWDTKWPREYREGERVRWKVAGNGGNAPEAGRPQHDKGRIAPAGDGRRRG